MIFADYIVLLTAVLISFANRQSLKFLYAFALCEALYMLSSTGFSASILIALSFSYIAIHANNIKHSLQMALICYSVLFWFAAADFLLFPYETLFYVIFPYVIKIIDLYVIYHLIAKQGRDNGTINSSLGSSFYQRLSSL